MTPLLFMLALATCLSTLFGGFLMLRFRGSQHYYFAFAAGSIITVVFLDLLPESLSIGSAMQIPSRTLFAVAVASFFFYSFVDRFFLTHHMHDDNTHGHPMGIIGAGSLVVHSCLDGVAIGIAFQASPSIGAIVASAVLVHDMTDGLNTVALMLKHHHTVKRAYLLLVLDALAPALGILLASTFVLPEKMLAYLLALFAGEFLYLGAGSLLPEIQNRGSLKTVAAMVSGVALISILTMLV